MEEKRKKIYNDMILVLLLLITALSVFIIWQVTRDDGAYAVVAVNKEEKAWYPLNKNGEYPLNGGTNILVISDEKAYISYADCPEQRCVHQGKVSLSGERIICLHNKVEVWIVSEKEGLS